MKRIILSIFFLGAAAGIIVQSSDKPKAAASPVVVDRSAEVAALKAEVADLTESLRVAALATTPSHAESEPREESPAPLVVTTPEPRQQPAAYVAAYSSLPRHQLRSPQCAGGVCGAELRPRVSGHKSEPRRFQPLRRKAILPWRR